MDEQYIMHGPKPLIPIPNESVGKQLYDSILKNINLPVAFVDAVTSESISNKVLLEKSCRLAESLRKYGIKQNDVVAICSENSLEFFFPVIAAMYLGVIITTLNNHYTASEICHCANISKPSLIFCSKNTLKVVLEAKKQLPYIQKVVVMNITATEEDDQCVTLEDFIATNSNAQTGVTKFKLTTVDPIEHVAFILYSSGTTGLSKGVMLTHNNINATITPSKDPRYCEQQDPKTATNLGLLPFYHVYGLATAFYSLMAGIRIVILTKFEPDVFLKTIQDYKISVIRGVPSLANFLAKSPLVDKYDLSSLKQFSCGAAPVTRDIEETIRKRLKLKWFRQGYGMTETTLTVVALSVNVNKSGSCGKLLPRMSAKVVDPATGKTLGPHQLGEFHFKGCLIMKGYAQNPEATKKVIDKNGWLATGDMGYYDEEGYFYIVDRLKELIKYKGFQVPPVELENILLSHPKIMDAGVVGLPNEIAGELPTAFVVTEPYAELTEREIVDFVAGRISPQKRLYGGVRFVNAIPKTSNGKILRRALRELLLTEKFNC